MDILGPIIYRDLVRRMQATIEDIHTYYVKLTSDKLLRISTINRSLVYIHNIIDREDTL